jgi:aerobic carbon-monoxide dehydrogenase large subunit
MSTYIGKSIKRKESFQSIQGKNSYLSDLDIPGMVYAGIHRSPFAHAVIKNVDVSRALRQPGVLAAMSGSDVRLLSRPMSPFPFTKTKPYTSDYPRVRFADHYCLAVERVRHAGEAVAVVVTEDRYAAADAVEEIDVDYEMLPPVVDVEEALKDEAPRLYDGWPDNIQYEFRFSEGAVDELLDASHLVIRERMSQHRYTGTPLETRGVIANIDPCDNLLTLWTTTQIPHSMPNLVLDTLDRPDLKIRVISPTMGGGFGIKWAFYPEEVLIPLLCLQLNRPMGWWETRSEHMVASHHSRAQVDYAEAGFDETGRITALKTKVIVDLGAAYPSGGTSLAFVTANFIPGPYKVENYATVSFGVVTNKTAAGPHRANGKAESNFVMERVLDRAALALGLGKDEIRLRNLIQPEEFPYTCVTGSIYDSGDYPTCLKKALQLADYEGLLEEQKECRKHGLYRGIGIGFMLEPLSSLRPNAYNAGYETVTVRVDPVGKAWVFSGDVNMSMSHETTLSQVVAEELGVRFEDVQVFEGDSALVSSSSGSYASRFSTVTLSAAIMACRTIKQKILEIAARHLECPPESLVCEAGTISDRADSRRRVSVKEVANTAYYSINLLPEGMDPGLHATHYFVNPNTSFYPDSKGRTANFSTFPYAAHVAYVEVDVRTGETRILKYLGVDDSGNMVNPMIVDTQITGAISHGLGGAFLEELVYDDQGQLLSGNFSDYLIPSAAEMPDLEIHHMVTPMPFTPGGFKGVGEIGAIGPPVVFASAIEDALAPLGVKIMRLPLKPENIWRAIREVGK